MGIQLRVLLVEDSSDDAVLVLRELRRGGYEVSHQQIDTPDAMKAALENKIWDLVISDYAMPRFSGDDALRLLRAKDRDVPFIFVSGTIGEESAVAALKVGAQDYLMKTNIKRLVPAVRRELRESEERRERRRLELHVQQLQKFEAIGRLAGGIAHDFNNALGAILGWAELAQGETQAGSRLHERLQRILDQTQRAAGLTAQLLAFARRQVLQPKKINLNTLIEEEVELLRTAIGKRIEVCVLLSADPQVASADPTQMGQVVMNLCLNARDSMPNGGKLTIETKNVAISPESCHLYAYSKPGNYVLLSVSDTGTGMDAATKECIFEPFFTTKEVGKGTGLGLATVYGVVKQHSGFINVQSELGQGTTFLIFLPAYSGPADPKKVNHDERSRRGTETILFAEDHDGLRESAREVLEALGYRVIFASSGTEAIRLFKMNCGQIDLVVLDVEMPGITGSDAYLQMMALQTDLAVIFTTGYASEATSLNSLIEKGAPILQKPYSPAKLTQMIGEVLDGRPIVRP
jgi:signal transduction histidine kinase